MRADLNISVSGLYLLAASSTPEAAREEALEQAKSGALSHQEIKQTISRHKSKNRNGKPLPDIEENSDSAERDLSLAAPEPAVETASREPTSSDDDAPALEDVNTPKIDGVPCNAPIESMPPPNSVRKEALWLWGRLQEFVSEGLLDKAPKP